MRVIVATGLNAGEAEYKNFGDVAMLQVAVSRLLDLWPDADVKVLTDSPANLARYCPRARPLPRQGCACWVGDRILMGRYHQLLPGWLSVRLSAWKRLARLRWPGLFAFLLGFRLRFGPGKERRKDLAAFLRHLNNADLLVVSGSGGFADSCPEWNQAILATVEAATRRSIPVAMFGQAIGPLTDPIVLSRMQDVFPAVSLLTLRGTKGGLALLKSIGALPARILETGDEALELAYACRPKDCGNAIGINLRMAVYSGVQHDLAESIRFVLQEFLSRHRAKILPIPVAVHETANDCQSIQRLLSGLENDSDGGLSLDTPQMLIEQAARCRIVVTGAYHAAVFALAQGVPVVCLANSPYYSAKFQGLQDQFGPAVEIIQLTEPDFTHTLAAAMERSWTSATTVRSSLLQSAARQVERSREAYRLVKDLIGSRTQEMSLLLPDGNRPGVS
jgi:colanic acid/amylovoran biosynthesis protein